MRDADDADDAGAVAVIVALVLALVLIPIAALALDLGSTYTAGAGLQRVANAAARAAARRQRAVPTPAQVDVIRAARTAAVDVLCRDALLSVGWSRQCLDRTWAEDRDVDPSSPSRRPDGEVEFYTGTPSDSTGTFGAGQRVDGSSAEPISGVRVVTPPASVRYGFAAILGLAGGTRQRAATAELRSVLPARDWNGRTGANSRLYLTENDLTGNAVSGAPAVAVWCARSGPRRSWRTSDGNESNHPTGACDPDRHPSVPRSFLDAASVHQFLVPGRQARLEPQVWPDIARLRTLRPGLFDPGGRLTGTGCPGGNASSTGGYPGVEAARLADFVDPRRTTLDAVRELLADGEPWSADRAGWLSPEILRCGRLALVPVLGGVDAPPDLYGLAAGPYAVVDVRLLWLDNTVAAADPLPIAGTVTPSTCLQRGFYWENAYVAGYCPARDEDDAPLRAITGYLLDPRLLPAVVAGDAGTLADRYLGSGLPATVRLVRDVSDPPPT
jgi:Flp pilus assembly protein TadG